jgi:amidase
LRPPTAKELSEISAQYGFALSANELKVFKEYIDGYIAPLYTEIDRMNEPKLEVRYPRSRGRRPARGENKFGAWAWRCSIKGSKTGLLTGKRIAIKDNIPVEGVQMSNGSALFGGYIPDIDASVVTRVLDAGGEIVGKSMCENFCASGGSHTSYPWPVKNPRDAKYMTGGSSSGSAALVASGEVDMALGTDEGGSVRIPSAWCGVYGLKPTFGLVPYTGVLDNEPTMDHVGPIASTVMDLAQLLEAIAGPDDIDPRQAISRPPSSPPSYAKSLKADVDGLRIGVVKEGFGWEASERDVDEVVKEEVLRFREMGAKVTEISVPFHRQAAAVFAALDTEGSWSIMVRDQFISYGWLGYYDSKVANFYGESKRTKAEDFPQTVKLTALVGHYLWQKYHSAYYAKAQNVRRSISEGYQRILEGFDLLAMPTTPQRAHAFPRKDDLMSSLVRSNDMANNTCIFNMTGNPALSMPIAVSSGLPIGMMLVGRNFHEQTLLDAAYAYEQIGRK